MAKSLSAGSPYDEVSNYDVFPILRTQEFTYPYMVRPLLYEAYYYGPAQALATVGDTVLIKFRKEDPPEYAAARSTFLPFGLIHGGLTESYAEDTFCLIFNSGSGPYRGDLTPGTNILQDGLIGGNGVSYPILRNRQAPNTQFGNNNMSNLHIGLIDSTLATQFNFQFELTTKNVGTGEYGVELTQWITGDEGNVYTTALGTSGITHWVDPTIIVGTPRAFFDPYLVENNPFYTPVCVAQATIDSVTWNIQ